MWSDTITAIAAVSLASALIGAILQYVGHSIHHRHREGPSDTASRYLD
jgi:uncharacterized membrane protein YGL010W